MRISFIGNGRGTVKNALVRKCALYCATAQRFVYLIMQRSGEDRVTQVAGSLTFTTVLSLVPLLTVTFALCTDFRDAKCILGACEEPDCSESDFAWHHFDGDNDDH